MLLCLLTEILWLLKNETLGVALLALVSAVVVLDGDGAGTRLRVPENPGQTRQDPEAGRSR